MPEWSLGFQESRICESGKLDALLRGHVEVGVFDAVWLWLAKNRARDCRVNTHAL
jgi:hypothetical protein